MADGFQVRGRNAKAPFTLTLHRGDGMLLLAMNWKRGKPPADFVGFAIEYREPGGNRFYALKNRLGFPGADGALAGTLSTLRSPIQKFRWVHFPRNAELPGAFTYRVTPVFMNAADELSYGEPQQADIELRRETHPGRLNLAFTRGFVSSQAFVDKYASDGMDIGTLLPPKAAQGLAFTPTHPKAEEALQWMGFEARSAILELLDEAIADGRAQVRVVAYDLNEPGIVTRLEQLGDRLRIIIDDEGDHGAASSGETVAARRLAATAGRTQVKRQHMGHLQHNKTIVVDGPKVKAVVCGSTNFSWRGFFVQANNAVVMRGAKAVKAFAAAFDAYWDHDDVPGFGKSTSARFVDLGLPGITAKLGFAPFTGRNVLLKRIADDIRTTESSLFFSLAFLYQTPGAIRDAIAGIARDPDVFVWGISDRKVGGLDVLRSEGGRRFVNPVELSRGAPPPFKAEPTGGGGNRMHHKFVVIDFDKPTARVYMGSYNFSTTADTKNGENILLFQDRRIAVSYVVEAVRLFDHYAFRLAQKEAKAKREPLTLKRPPRARGEKPWWDKDWSNPRRVRDRELFA